MALGTHRLTSRLAYRLGLVAATCCLTACARDKEAPQTPVVAADTAPAANAAAQLPAIRVIVQFSQSGDYQSYAFLQRIQHHTLAQVHYIASVFNDTHVYGLQPSAGQTYQQVLDRLRTMPEVARVEVDQKSKRQ